MKTEREGKRQMTAVRGEERRGEVRGEVRRERSCPSLLSVWLLWAGGGASESQGFRCQEIKHKMKTSSGLNILPCHFSISQIPYSDLRREEECE